MAKRSVRDKARCSSSSSPSSRATTPNRAGLVKARPSRSVATSRLSIAAASLAAVPALTRSAMATMTTPPSASASKPRSAIGCPDWSVAARSRPPSNRPSAILAGMRRTGASGASSAQNPCSQASRTGPAWARKRIPPMVSLATASTAAAIMAWSQADNGSVWDGLFMRQKSQPTRVQHGLLHGTRQGDCDANGGAKPWVQQNECGCRLSALPPQAHIKHGRYG